MQKFVHGIAPALKAAGKALDSVGASLEGFQTIEKLVPSTRSMTYKGTTPQVDSTAFVASTASVIGDVSVGANSSIWYGAKVRGDVHSIKIGRNVSIGDNAMVHVARIQGDHPTIIGDNVTIGSNAVVHACTLQSNSMVGHGAQVLDGATVESNAIVAPGALVTPNKTVGAGQLWAGSPAKYLRDLTEEEIASILTSANETAELGAMYAFESSKTPEQVTADENVRFNTENSHPDNPSPYHDGNDIPEHAETIPGLIFNTKTNQADETKYAKPYAYTSPN